MNKKQPNRKRTVTFHFKATEEEAALIRERMKTAGINNMGAYMRKMAIDGYFINLDLTYVKELVFLMRNATNNLNQIAKRLNERNSIYESNIRDMQKHFDELWQMLNTILMKLSCIR